MFLQVLIFAIGVLDIWLLNLEDPWRKWGYPLGVVSQVPWAYLSITTNQYGILCLSIVYTFLFSIGTYKHLIKKKDDITRKN